MCPGEEIKNCEIGGQIKYPHTSQHAVDQRNPDKTTVGIYRAVAVDTGIRMPLFWKKEGGYRYAYDMGNHCSGKRDQKTIDQPGIVCCLKHRKHNTRVYNQQEQVGHCEIDVYKRQGPDTGERTEIV